MHRTRNRPLVTGAVTPRAALIFALAWRGGLRGVVVAVNLLSAVLAVSATAFYVFVYTLWLKRRSSQNIVIGGAAGAVPVLVGWAAVTGRLGVDAGRAVRHHLHVDAAALLGAGRPLPRGLRGGQRADAAGGGLDAPDHRGDPPLHGGAGGGDARSSRRWPHMGIAVHRGGGRPRCGLSRHGGPVVASGPGGTRPRGRRHAAVQLLDHLPHHPLRGDGRDVLVRYH